MPLTKDLMGLGVAAALASRIGYNEAALPGVVGNGTAQIGATQLNGALSYLAPAGGNTAYMLSPTAPLTKLHLICNPTAVAGVLFPPPGGQINGGAVNASIAIPANGFLIVTCAANPGGASPQWFAK